MTDADPGGPPDPNRPGDCRIVLIAVDGLSARWVGALGNTSAPTPGLDRLACEGVVLHGLHAADVTAEGAWPALLTGSAPPADGGVRAADWLTDAAGAGRMTVLVDGAGLPAALRERFETVVVVAEDEDPADEDDATESRSGEGAAVDAAPAKSVETMALVRTLSVAREVIQEAPPDAAIVVAVAGLRGPWDVPLEERAAHRGEDDPEPYPGISPPMERLDRQADADAILAYELAATAMVAALDDAIAALIEELAEARLLEETLLLVTAPRGYALGEHGFVGPPDAQVPVRAESYHVPGLLRLPRREEPSGAPSAVWLIGWPGLLATTDLGSVLLRLASEGPPRTTPASEDPARTVEGRLGETLPSRSLVTVVHPAGRLVRTAAWLYDPGKSGWDIASEGENAPAAALFVKPDDRFDVHDVSARARDVAEAFETLLAEGADEGRPVATDDERFAVLWTRPD